MNKRFNLVLKLLYPAACPVCDEVLPQLLTGDSKGRICPECERQLHRVTTPFCMRCGKPLGKQGVRKEYCEDCATKTHVFTQGRAVFVYQGPIIGTMHRFKYSNRRDYAQALAHEAYVACGEWIQSVAPEALIPVPLHKKRMRQRGYNQAQLLARELSLQTGIPVESKLLLRTRNTAPQKQLHALERKNNLKNAFQMSKKKVQLEKVLLIDDIYTTGSTVDAAAESLMGAGVKKVYVLCICTGRGDEEV